MPECSLNRLNSFKGKEGDFCVVHNPGLCTGIQRVLEIVVGIRWKEIL